MKKISLIVLTALSLAACSKVGVGEVGIKVNNMGGDKGVNDQVLGTGWYWVGFTKTLYTFPTYMQTRKWEGREEFQFQTVEGMTVGAPISISYAVEPSKVPLLFQTYKKGLEEITDTYIHNIIRDNLVLVGSTRTIDDIYGAGKGKMLADLQAAVATKLEPMGVHVDQISVVGGFTLPTNVVQSINTKIQATQMAQQRENEVATAKAEAQKAVAVAQGEADSTMVRAKAQAQANVLLSSSITPTTLQQRALEVQAEAINKWDGKLPDTIMGQSVPFINLNANK